MLGAREEKFLKSRRKLSALGTPVFALLLLLVVGTYAYCAFRSPLLGNPFYLVDSLQQGQVDDNMLLFLPLMASAYFHVAWFLLSLVMVLGIVVFTMEKKYLAVIDALRSGEGQEAADGEERGTHEEASRFVVEQG